MVSETTSEIMIATDKVTANSRNSRPTMPPISRIGTKTAISERLIDSTVKATSRAPCSAASHPRHPGLDVPGDVFEHDDRIVDDKAGRDRQRHQRQIVEAVAQQIHHAEGADQRDRHRDARDQGSAQIAQEHEDDQDDEADRDDQRALDLVQRAS